MLGMCLFDTRIGRCAVAWGDRGIVGIQLPELDDARTAGRLLDRVGGATSESTPPPAVRTAIRGMQGLLEGRGGDLSGVVLDTSAVTPFRQRVYDAARQVPVGTTMSYGELAAEMGAPGAARAVGQALGQNPFAIVVPCHRITAAGGKPGGFSAPGGVETKQRMLAFEAPGA